MSTDTVDTSSVTSIYVVEICLAAMGILCSLFVLFVFICYKQLRTWPFELVSYLCFSSMINSCSYIIYFTPTHYDAHDIDIPKCHIQAFLMIWFENSQFLWAMLVGYSIYDSIVVLKDDESESVGCGKRALYLVSAFGIPFIFSSLALVSDGMGPVGNWCWIGEVHDNSHVINDDTPWTKSLAFSLRTRLFSASLLGFSIIIMLLNWYYIYSTIKSLYKEFKAPEERNMIKGYVSKISLYPLIQTVCMLPSIINKFIVCVFLKEFIILNSIQTMCVSSQGIWYALVYGCNTKVKRALADTFNNRLCCGKKVIKKNSVISNQDSEYLDIEDSRSEREIAIINDD